MGTAWAVPREANGRMETIIGELVRIEASARTVVDEALARKERLGELIAEKTAEIDRASEAKAEAEIGAARANAAAETEKRLSKINESSKKWIASLEERYAQYHADWEAEIFNNIIGDAN